MAPPRGERANKEGAWVRKGAGEGAGAGGGGEEGGDQEGHRGDRRDGGRGRGRQQREGGRGAGRRDGREKDASAAVEEGIVNEGGKGGRGRGKGAQKGARREKGGQQQDHAAAEDKENFSGDEGEEMNSGTALLSMLKATPPGQSKVVRYTKVELLSIARLPASNVKPPDLSPLIDRENKESQLLIRMAGSRSMGDDDGADPERQKRRERRNDRRQPHDDEEEEYAAPAPNHARKNQEAPAAPAVAS
eukprot:CAMPEP_0203865414 /NCGR_PEP_ID=MMETSP0359-20131031/15345_1 /ASSEMBLY_ACC=CAM_ASM_000338 /TAXON_ID=268821 /ORGANISM="Scrippsiella Hangoei, Strain SHTV-5" /LENGTH=246 /DNA_ID=CAMNT_0050783337 /DNA_START=126 /DNA_END=863 /DNA_ORIENTATION=+